MDFILTIMDFTVKMMDFILKMMECEQGSYPRMDKLLHESPTGNTAKETDMPLG